MTIIDLKNIINSNKFIHNNDVNINEIQFDSRKVKEGDIFVAIPGTVSDGHKYIETAIDK
ncbi:Mur ligase domain-containing protein, partial [Bacteroidales bacterium OttesenSCG-928-I21]|nr:Mur ligase domain-containing protein [Bacteroidales bacterium OttesenSCG-928-I21]